MTSSSGTRTPLSMYSSATLPSSVPLATSSRSRSPVAIRARSKCSAIRLAWVPLPAPEGPISSTRMAGPPGCSVVLGGVGLGLGLVDGAGGVLWRGVDGDQAQGAVAGVDEVVAGPGRDQHQVVGAHLGGPGVQDGVGLAVHEHQQLVVLLVDLLADLAAGRDGHGNDLAVLTGGDLAPEGVVAPGQLDDVDVEGIGHGRSSAGTLVRVRLAGLDQPGQARQPAAASH